MILFSRSKISVGVRGVVCDLADTILKSTWFACDQPTIYFHSFVPIQFACGPKKLIEFLDPSYTAAHYCEPDLSLITTICVCVLRSDFKLSSHDRSPWEHRVHVQPGLAPDAVGSAVPDFNFIFVIPESGMHRAHQHIGIRTIHHYCNHTHDAVSDTQSSLDDDTGPRQMKCRSIRF
ncbi:hypothetical protein B0H14DRAFT_2562424 [Mycena olivaceomarginata]|nr:hypothetical protein B0H14DRAFT_2562424 [Mycena olivaceomarginata]